MLKSSATNCVEFRYDWGIEDWDHFHFLLIHGGIRKAVQNGQREHIHQHDQWQWHYFLLRLAVISVANEI